MSALFFSIDNSLMTNETSLAVEILGCNIKKLRKQRNITQEQLAESIGKTAKYISLLERSLAFPSADTLDLIAKALYVPVFRLFVPDQFQSSEESQLPTSFLKRELFRIISEID